MPLKLRNRPNQSAKRIARQIRRGKRPGPTTNYPDLLEHKLESQVPTDADLKSSAPGSYLNPLGVTRVDIDVKHQ